MNIVVLEIHWSYDVEFFFRRKIIFELWISSLSLLQVRGRRSFGTTDSWKNSDGDFSFLEKGELKSSRVISSLSSSVCRCNGSIHRLILCTVKKSVRSGLKPEVSILRRFWTLIAVVVLQLSIGSFTQLLITILTTCHTLFRPCTCMSA